MQQQHAAGLAAIVAPGLERAPPAHTSASQLATDAQTEEVRDAEAA